MSAVAKRDIDDAHEPRLCERERLVRRRQRTDSHHLCDDKHGEDDGVNEQREKRKRASAQLLLT